jgi:asparagine synthase (glutamine-hydrolysing)
MKIDRLAVVLNGEIYNYRELRDDLEARGHTFRSASDTEVLPHLYEEYGRDMVQHLNGMFAFALWDDRRRRLFIARDRFGEKPLYWGVFDRTLLFASEPKVLLAHPAVRPDLNLNALRQYLSYDYVPAPLSIYEGINKAAGAHHLTLEDGQVEVKRYWQLRYKPREPVPTGFEAAVAAALICSKIQCACGWSLTCRWECCYSGGIDSSMVTALASALLIRKPLRHFRSLRGRILLMNRSTRVAFAQFLGTDHHEERL